MAKLDIETGCPDAIEPLEYARWRGTYLGVLTERIEAEAIFGLAGDLRGKRLLDLGGGDGAYSIAASQKGALVSGLDISKAMLEAAERRATAIGASVGFLGVTKVTAAHGMRAYGRVQGGCHERHGLP